MGWAGALGGEDRGAITGAAPGGEGGGAQWAQLGVGAPPSSGYGNNNNNNKNPMANIMLMVIC